MVMLRVGGIAATIAIICFGYVGPVMACESRSPQHCLKTAAVGVATNDAFDLSAAKRSRSKRSQASQVAEQEPQAEQAVEESPVRYTRKKRASRTSYARSRSKVKQAAAAAEQTDAPASTASRRRFRAFIDPTSMTDKDVETWKQPQPDISLFFPEATPDKTANAAAPAMVALAPQATATHPQEAPTPVLAAADQPVTEPAGVASQGNEVSVENEPPSTSVGMQATPAEDTVSTPPTAPDSTALRSLMLALGGVVTLASALRFLVSI